MATLAEIYEQLKATQPPTQLSFLNTRLMLDTGINLRSIRPEDAQSQAAVAKVRTALKAMGVSI